MENISDLIKKYSKIYEEELYQMGLNSREVLKKVEEWKKDMINFYLSTNLSIEEIKNMFDENIKKIK